MCLMCHPPRASANPQDLPCRRKLCQPFRHGSVSSMWRQPTDAAAPGNIHATTSMIMPVVAEIAVSAIPASAANKSRDRSLKLQCSAAMARRGQPPGLPPLMQAMQVVA